MGQAEAQPPIASQDQRCGQSRVWERLFLKHELVRDKEAERVLHGLIDGHRNRYSPAKRSFFILRKRSADMKVSYDTLRSSLCGVPGLIDWSLVDRTPSSTMRLRWSRGRQVFHDLCQRVRGWRPAGRVPPAGAVQGAYVKLIAGLG